MCFRRLNATHQTGCSCELINSINFPASSQLSFPLIFSAAGKSSVGALHYVRNTNDIDFLLDSPPAPPYIALMSPHYFTREYILKFRDSKFVSGIILINDTHRLQNFSQESRCPNEFSLYPQQPQCDASKPETQWNPYGSGLLQENFDIPIMYIPDKEQIDKLIKCFEDFNSDITKHGSRSLCSVEIQAFMAAAGNSEICMRRGDRVRTFSFSKFCDPLQSRNIYATLFPREIVEPENRTNDVTEKFIVISTRLDTTTGFDLIATGALDSLTSIATLLATGHFLRRVISNEITKENKNIMFVFFNGESYDFIGSQRFAYDLKNGDVFPSRKTFTRPINMSNIEALIDIGPLDGFDELVLYSVNNETLAGQFVNAANKYNDQLKLNINLRNEIGNNIPPVSVHSFLRENSTFPAFALATKTPSNRFFHSVFDDEKNIDYHYQNVSRDFDELDESAANEFNATSVQIKVRNIATIIGMTLFEIIKGTPYTGGKLASSVFIDEFLYCFLKSTNCKLIRATYNFTEEMHFFNLPLDRYVSVQVNAVMETIIWSNKIMGFALSQKIENVTEKNCTTLPLVWVPGSKSIGECRQTTHNYSFAASPAFEEENYDFKSGKYSTWTESTWNSLSSRMFLRPSAAHESLTVSWNFNAK